MTSRVDILGSALQFVTVDRAATHGAAKDSFARIAAIWSLRLGVEITAAQVALMMVDFKTVRAWGNPSHADTYPDIAGYAALAGEIASGE